MPGIGSLIREIDVNISEISKKQTYFCLIKSRPACKVLTTCVVMLLKWYGFETTYGSVEKRKKKKKEKTDAE